MKLVTFQSFDAVKYLFENGYLKYDKKKIYNEKYSDVYSWIIEKMNSKVKNECGATYPLWSWVKCYNKISPNKVKGKKVDGFDVKITFHKKKKDVFITDFRRYSFLLNNMYIPLNKKEKKVFDEKLKKLNITSEELKAYIRKKEGYRNDKSFLEICNEIKKTFDRCITEDSDVLQACIWDIKLNEIEKIEILKDDGYAYGTLNYIRSNGKRKNWINEYYKMLK